MAEQRHLAMTREVLARLSSPKNYYLVGLDQVGGFQQAEAIRWAQDMVG